MQRPFKLGPSGTWARRGSQEGPDCLYARASGESFTGTSTHLNRRNEVPNAVESSAQGEAIFQLSKDGSELRYKLIVANIQNV